MFIAFWHELAFSCLSAHSLRRSGSKPSRIILSFLSTARGLKINTFPVTFSLAQFLKWFKSTRKLLIFFLVLSIQFITELKTAFSQTL
jgi:hypothetical protein